MRRIERASLLGAGSALLALLGMAVALGLLWQGARLVFQPDSRDDLRRADALFAAGRYHDARAAYAAIVDRHPRFAAGLLRLGVVCAVRGERDAATQALALAIAAGADPAEREVIRLYQGQLAATAGRQAEAARFWRLIGAGSPLLGVQRVLEAESRLSAGDDAGAEERYRSALAASLPAEWRALALTRAALLHAAGDPAAAEADLKDIHAGARTWSQPATTWAAPLRPAAEPDAGQLAEVLRATPDRRAQMLGQIYLAAGLYGLAEAQFAMVDPNGAGAHAAAAYAAFTRWRAGDQAAGIRQLQDLVAARPDDTRARALLALAYLSSRDETSARTQLEIARALAPRAPDTRLAWAQWHVAQHDYVAAADEFAAALRDSSPAERGVYALALARFHADVSFEVCEAGLPAAEQAASLRADDEQAWIVLAAARLSCADPSGARDAAARALQLRRGPEALYYLGRALALLGDRSGARAALVRAADLAPASPWRERAEAQIAALGL